MRQILVHLLDRLLIDGLAAQILDPPQQRRRRRSQLMRRLLRQTDPHAVLFVLLRRTEGDVSDEDEEKDDPQLHVREEVKPFEQLRLAVEDDVPVFGTPPIVDRLGLVLLREAVDLAAQPVGMVQHLARHQMRLDDVEPLVGDDEGDVVAVREDALDERIVDRAAEGVAARLLHGVRPHLDVVLLLLAQVVRHAVGVDQRQQADDHAHGDHHDPVAERERIAVEQVFQRPACGIGFIFGRYPVRAGCGRTPSRRRAVRRRDAPRGPP